MGRLLGKQHIRDLCLALGLLCAALALVLWPGEAMSAMKDGLSLCGNVILPSLFPFFVLSSLVVELKGFGKEEDEKGIFGFFKKKKK